MPLSYYFLNLQINLLFQSETSRFPFAEMRKQLLLAEIIILIVACTATSNNLLSVEEILQTNQYLLIAQQDGVTYIQRNVTRGICPLFMSKTK